MQMFNLEHYTSIKWTSFGPLVFYVLWFLLDSDHKLTALGFELFMVDLNPNYSHWG